ncbi:hypothetical protein M430DRAFT_143450 [Amorphotheca resinae ATCC 22711]|uniref:Uncharacterized protein n=1 Tax=Amorphotheca resinae ATCC 22711 TaxID=857342 RepID=A0A2T3AWB9_AMORE|nr:hypothetical protein M430DRAFT_143450 [Amorphotheca resinae ATCC 22711]PSS12961.1 hypothetical protein M430DRAFT_143450 [Amorphotheca resinae ATCC 22711]
MQPNACAVRKVAADMTGDGANGEKDPRRSQNGLPPEILDIVWPALQVGGLSGMSGILVGTFAGILRSTTTPALFALASGIQWFTLGSAFTASREVVLQAWGKDKVTPRDKVSASAIAGGVGGTAGGLLRGPKNIIPGAIMFALCGAAGQTLYNRADARNAEPQASESKKSSWLNSKWSPMKVLTDSEYENMLQEKLLRVNVEIALIDESIEKLRAQERGEAREVENETKSK